MEVVAAKGGLERKVTLAWPSSKVRSRRGFFAKKVLVLATGQQRMRDLQDFADRAN
jgi:hypothetical protein